MKYISNGTSSSYIHYNFRFLCMLICQNLMIKVYMCICMHMHIYTCIYTIYKMFIVHCLENHAALNVKWLIASVLCGFGLVFIVASINIFYINPI